MYDVIGDVHGQGAKLQALLGQLGYARRGGTWQAPQGRQAIFVGDLIDRGPEQLEVLDTVRRMVDSGQARLVLGNHEFNAMGYAVTDLTTGQPLRPHSAKNQAQHAAFLQAVGEGSAAHREWVDWFRLQPLALDLGGVRVVHAWWDTQACATVAAVRGGDAGRLDDERLTVLYRDPAATAARKLLTCGVEWPLPENTWITDKEGHRHGEVRLAVWRDQAERLPQIALVPRGNEPHVPDLPIPAALRQGPVRGAPILFGHHWFVGTPTLESSKVACLDWSAAKGGPLVAYRWNGEAELRAEGLVAAGA